MIYEEISNGVRKEVLELYKADAFVSRRPGRTTSRVIS